MFQTMIFMQYTFYQKMNYFMFDTFVNLKVTDT